MNLPPSMRLLNSSVVANSLWTHCYPRMQFPDQSENGPKSPRIGDGCIGRVHLATQTGCVVYTGSQFLLFTTPHDLVVTANLAPCTMIDSLLKIEAQLENTAQSISILEDASRRFDLSK